MALGSTQSLTEMSTRIISWGQRRPVRKADKLTTILCRCHKIWETLTSWNPLGHSRPVTGLFYLLQHPKQMHTVIERAACANTHTAFRGFVLCGIANSRDHAKNKKYITRTLHWIGASKLFDNSDRSSSHVARFPGPGGEETPLPFPKAKKKAKK